MIILADARHVPLKDRLVQMVCTSPPYFRQRSYNVDRQIGLESTPALYIKQIVKVFREVRRVLRDDGTAWLVLGDSYAGAGSGHRDPKRWPKQAPGEHFPKVRKNSTGLPDKNLLGIPWRAVLALQRDGWLLRSAIIWHKPTAFPEAVKDRPANSSEHIFLLSKSGRYYYGGPRLTNVWSIPADRTRENHFATFPKKLVERCIVAGSRPGDLVFDPFVGSGTTGVVAEQLGRRWVGLDLNPSYLTDVKRTMMERARLRFARFTYTDQEILEIMGCRRRVGSA